MNSSKSNSAHQPNVPDDSEILNGNILSKISCKIAGHLGYAYINTGSSVSIASSYLYKKLVQDNCPFKERSGVLHLVDGALPQLNYRVTSTTVSVIGKTKSIDLLAFPNIHIERTVLGIDYVCSKTKNTNIKALPQPKKTQSRNKTNSKPPMKLVEWILNSNSLQTPLYNILTQEIATDQDIRAICDFMKLPVEYARPLSPIK